PNPSFENYDTCPTNLDQINYAVGWYNCGIDPDYLNSCANISHPIVGSPINIWGDQIAYDGVAYAALVTWNLSVQNAREFMGIQLIQNLVPGTKYYVTGYVVPVKN